MKLRPNRVQPSVVQAILSEALGQEAAAAILKHAGIAGLPDHVPSGPRDLDLLAAELAPFVRLYRTLQERIDTKSALALVRRAIIESGLVTHSADVTAQQTAVAAGRQEEYPHTAREVEPLNLVSPPPPGFSMPPEALQSAFNLAMQYFSCTGELLTYTAEEVRFHITGCNWCRAMERLGAPELIEFFCETDEHFMDTHPTHRLRLPSTIGRGGHRCEFQFVRKEHVED
ncbi:MAG: L-2-amino-thiazoline-4-carboxylic acid hydrolase [Armatimonadota bacterium]